MAKLTLLLATFTLFLFATNATIYQTTVVIDDEENHHIQRRCQQELQQQQMLRRCEMFLSQMTEELGQGQWPGEEEQLQKTQNLQQCCRQLQQVRTPCRCMGLKQVVRSQESQGRLSGQQRSVLYQMAETIPAECKLPPRQCDLTSSYGMKARSEEIHGQNICVCMKY